MGIHYLDRTASNKQLADMLRTLGDYVKVAVDIDRRCLAGGGAMHADCQRVLLDNGCQNENVWGADWIPDQNALRFASLINVRPAQGNRSTEIQNPHTRAAIESVVKELLASG